MTYTDLFTIQEVSFAISETPDVQVADILREVSDFHGVTVNQILNGGKVRKVSVPRHEAMWLARKLVKGSLEYLGIEFNRDKGTVLHAIRTVDSYIKKGRVESDDLIMLLARFPSVAYH